MNSSNYIEIQGTYSTTLREGQIASFDLETDLNSTRPLLHKQSRFLYIIDGKGKILIQNQVHIMEPGVVITLLPWQISEIIEVSEPISYYLLIYSFDLINNVIKRIFNIDNEEFNMVDLLYKNNSIFLNESDSRKFKRIFEDIRDEVGMRSVDINTNKMDFSGIYVVSKLTELIVEYLRHTKKEYKNENTPLPSEEIFQYMYLNSQKKISLKEMSRIFLMSESSISRYIYSMTGLGFYDLLNEMKYAKAIFFLLYTDMTLEEIAEILNYTDAAHFSKTFNNRNGMGSKKFRETYQNINKITHIKHDKNTGQMIDYIYKNYYKNLNINLISKKFDMTITSINDSLRYLVELNFSNFLNRIRINKAASLLLNTDKTITDIALEVGYNSTKTFNRNFLKFMKINPGEFRALVTEQNDKEKNF
ncbi:AraC family transcriptional regulator [Peptoniphilus sp. BV3C26]|uniref:helix-turn-helix domain-containing protein n=1 Tax=Peptoniphilus sp. BV3C26 TaxID=1111134 RepID=UPI0003B8F6CE|nr:AraC family transcriptional regulator [Peptoniphilus sp. BV3C26]ERT59468.1 DNA-binding helix-turn-helix protein [Peptoniphilus sp. BV3C26]